MRAASEGRGNGKKRQRGQNKEQAKELQSGAQAAPARDRRLDPAWSSTTQPDAG
jgi:hypothetical protein